MVITDIDTALTSREASGRFQISLAKPAPAKPQGTLFALSPIAEREQALKRIAATVSARKILWSKGAANF